MQNYRNLIVWQKAHQLTLDVYNVSTSFPKEEVFGLTSQLRRASSSVPTNLAEGSAKLTDLDFRRFVSIAFGSANETEYIIFLSFELKYISEEEYLKLDAQTKEVKKMLAGLIESLGKRIFYKGLFVSILLAGMLSVFSIFS